MLQTAQTFDEVFMTGAHDPDDSKSLCSTRMSSWQQKMVQQCEEGFKYCWMTCLPLPSNCSDEHAICLGDDGHQCEDEDMDATCKWKCCESSKNDGNKDHGDKFCTGGTDMLMTGFDVVGGSGKTCIILFFKGGLAKFPVTLLIKLQLLL